MYVLDTNIVSMILRGNAPQELRDRLVQTAPHERFVCSVTVVESLEGALALVRREESQKEGTQGHRLLLRLMRDFASYPTVLYDDAAAALFEAMPASLKRRGSRDCRIAACALRYNLTLVTQNSADFQTIPGLVCEDWTTRGK